MTEKELDEIIAKRAEEKAQAPEPTKQLSNIVEQNGFNAAVDNVKLAILQDSGTNDEKFIKEVKENVKDATIKLTEVEKEKAELEKQNVLYFQELKDKERQLNEYEKQSNSWENKQKRRQYHYDGVKPIMEFVGIKTPMNLAMLYFLTFILVWFFLIAKLFKGTIGALVAGAEDENRPKAVKGFLWTTLALVVLVVIAVIVLLVLKHFAIIK